MKYTTNYKLKKPEGSDTVNIEDINDNMDTLDSELSFHIGDFVREPAFLTASSDGNNYTASSTPNPTAYVDGMGIVLKADKDSTGEVTLNWNGLGAKALKDAQGNNITLKANGIYTFKYNGDMEYFMLQGSNIYANGQVQTNLNSDLLDGKNASDFAPSGYGLGGISTSITGQDLNNIVNTGFYAGNNLTNAPTSEDWFYIEVQCHTDSSWVSQIAKTYGDQNNAPNIGEIYTRNKIANTWSPWRKLQNENYAVTTNSGNAYSVTIGGLSSLTDGLQIRVKFTAASTGVTTLNLNGLGDKAIVDYFGNAVTNIRQNLIANLCYESTSGNFILQGKGGGGNATSADLLSGKTATVDGGQITGSMINRSGVHTQAVKKAVGDYDGLGITAYIMPQKGYYSNDSSDSWVYSQENDLITDNIKSGKTIFGVSGKSSVVDTADATATTSQIFNGQTAYVNGSKVTGTNKYMVGATLTDDNLNITQLGSSEIWSLSDVPFAYDIAVDSSGNVYVAYANSSGSGKTVRKLNSSGVEIWSLSDVPAAYDIAVDSSGNVYVAYYNSSDKTVRKLNSSGVEVWSLSDIVYAGGIAVDSSGNVYVAYVNSSGKTVRKLNSSGVEIWSLSDVPFAYDIAVDSSGNVYVAYANSSGSGKTVRKLNSSGVEVWSLSDIVYASGIAVDSSGNVYVTYHSGAAGKTVRKLYGSGVEIWSDSSDASYAQGIAVNSSGNVYVAYSMGGGKVTVKKLYGKNIYTIKS